MKKLGVYYLGEFVDSKIHFFICIICIALLFNSCSGEGRTKYIRGSTMGTFYIITYVADIDERSLKSEIEKKLSKIEQQLSNWEENSWISQFNQSNSTDFFTIPEHASRVIKYAVKLSDLTNGALDPTIGSLINLWGFGPVKRISLPSKLSIEKALNSSGMDKLIFMENPTQLAKSHPKLRLNVSSVTKGYATDILANKLKMKGIQNYLINIGGEMRISGHPAGSPFWEVGIQYPSQDAREGVAIDNLKLKHTAGLATSGNYRQFFDKKGRHFSHILDPKTGKPVQNNLVSVSIIASTAMKADGFATACLVIGLKKSKRLIEKMPKIEGLLIKRTKKKELKIVTTSGWPSLNTEAKKYSELVMVN